MLREPGVEVALARCRARAPAGIGALEAAAEGRLHRDLHALAARPRPACAMAMMRAGGLGGAHAGVLAAVGLAGRDAHAEHLDAAGQAALEPLLVQHEAREHDVRPAASGAARWRNSSSVSAICGTFSGWTNEPDLDRCRRPAPASAAIQRELAARSGRPASRSAGRRAVRLRG
ncbi:MAG: hypothetical protein MZV64_28295 [Ignavibacteriales bacterium]|nr:hypothetical protein [Ignavibacteriales bacterium]